MGVRMWGGGRVWWFIVICLSGLSFFRCGFGSFFSSCFSYDFSLPVYSVTPVSVRISSSSSSSSSSSASSSSPSSASSSSPSSSSHLSLLLVPGVHHYCCCSYCCCCCFFPPSRHNCKQATTTRNMDLLLFKFKSFQLKIKRQRINLLITLPFLDPSILGNRYKGISI